MTTKELPCSRCGQDLHIPARYNAGNIAALEKRVEELEDALEHCGYDPTDCIDCGGPPHNEWCRFWKLRDFVPALFDLAQPMTSRRQ